MNSSFDDPFIIIKCFPEESLDEFQSEIKERKPTVYTWTQTENQLYLSFLKRNIQILVCKKERKSVKIFRTMSEAIKTRSSVQIKSHHQKMEKKYKTIKNIILCLQRSLSQSKGHPVTSQAETMTNIHDQMSPNISEASESSENPPFFEQFAYRSQEQELFFEDDSQSIQRIRIDVAYDVNQSLI